MPVSPDLLEILRCPDDLSALREAGADLIAQLNQAIAAGQVRNKGGEAVAEVVQGGLVRADGQLLYPVRDEIPVMLVEEGIPLAPLGLAQPAA